MQSQRSHARKLALTGCLPIALSLLACSGNEKVDGDGPAGPSSGAGNALGGQGGGAAASGAAPVRGGGSSQAGAMAAGGTAAGGTSSGAGGRAQAGGGPNGGVTNGGAGNAGGGTSGGATADGGAGRAGGQAAGGAGEGGAAAGASSGGGAPSCGAGMPVTFGTNVRLNDDTGRADQNEVALATGNGLALAGWMDNRASRVCAYSVSTDNGATWSRNVSIPNVSGQFVGDPAVAIDGGGTLYAVCQEYLDLNAGTGNVRLMTSTDKGMSWSTVSTIQSAPDKPWVGGGPADGTVFVSWLGTKAGIKRSLDHGATWGTTQSLGNIIHGTAIVASTSGLVHVPYNLDSDRNQLRYVRSSDGGATWEKPRDLVADMGRFCFECSPRQHPIVGAAADPTGKTVVITWTSTMPGGEGDDDVWILYSRDGGDSWTKPIRVNDNTAAARQFQSWVGVDACNRVHVAWTDLRNGKNEVWYARSADPTQGFEPNVEVTDASGAATSDFIGDFKGLAIAGSDVLITWTDTRRDGGDIYFSRAVGAAAP